MARARRSEDAQTLSLLLHPILGDQATVLSAALVKRAGSIARVVALSDDKLIEIAGSEAACLIRAVQAVSVALLRPEKDHRTAIDSNILADYFTARLAHLTKEEVHAVYLDAKNCLLEERRIATGSASRLDVSLREIIGGALDTGATGVVLIHNHPSGDPTPSSEDIALTNRLTAIGRELEVIIHDHIIVSRTGWASMRARKLLE